MKLDCVLFIHNWYTALLSLSAVQSNEVRIFLPSDIIPHDPVTTYPYKAIHIFLRFLFIQGAILLTNNSPIPC